MKKTILFLFLFSTITVLAQKEANIWYFGRNAGVDFNTSPPIAITDGALNTLEGCSSFSDAFGNLLFYSDGITVWDKNHAIMNYTDGNPANNLKGDPSSTQSGMIIPKPGTSNIYYLFTVGNNSNPAFDYYTIDMSLNGGFGELIDENGDGLFVEDLASSTGMLFDWTEKVAAVRGSECNTYWVVSLSQNTFFSYKIDVSGVNTTPITSIVNNNSLNTRGYLKMSPDGSKVLVIDQNEGQQCLMYSFDNSTGVVSNDGYDFLISNFEDGEAYGAEFSRSSNKLYISTVSGFRYTMADPETTYKLFQFDLTVTDIAASKTLIHEEIGYRGALQLGPDGKIYATIPLAYDDVVGDAPFLDVIENPEAAAADVIFTIDAIDLNGKMATQGLPPFIASLLLPIEITNTDTGQVINNQNLQFCTGQTRIITPETVSGDNLTYNWIFDDGSGTFISIADTPSLTLTDIDHSNTGFYQLIVELTDACGDSVRLEGEFNITIYDQSIASQPSDIYFCDVDSDGFNTFDLTATVTPEVLNGEDPASFEVSYFLSQTDADTNTNPITNPYTNPTANSSQVIYVRMHNNLVPTVCFDTSKSFNLVVSSLPVAQTPLPYNSCDDIESGSDTDGVSTNFLLNTKDTEILGALNPAIYTVSYHTTLIDAQTSSSTNPIDKTSPYTNTSTNLQTIFVRIESTTNSDCNDITQTVDLVVNPNPVVIASAELKQCDDDTDGITNFNLNEANSLISVDAANETFTFYTSETAAQTGGTTDLIANPTTFSASNGVTVWTRVETVFGCYRTAQINLVVSTTQIPSSFTRTFTQCDDFLDIDGNDTLNNDDTDGVSAFDFSAVTADVIALFPVGQQLTVQYYRNEADALAELNVITDPSNYRNSGYPTSQQIYVRVDSDLDNACIGFGPYITLNVTSVPLENSVPNLFSCDDFESSSYTDGVSTDFMLSDQTATILGGQDPAVIAVTYHASAAEANTGTNPLASPYTNTIPNLQTIYVRLTNTLAGCFTDHITFDLVVQPLPIAHPVADLEICDDDSDGSARNGFSQSLNLETQSATILGAQDPSLFSLTYHESLANAQAGILPLSSPFSNSVPFLQTIYVRVVNNNTLCSNGISNFNIIVNQEPLANPNNTVSNLSYCDDDNAGLGDDTDGIYENIDLDSQIPDILGSSQATADFFVTFHLLQSEATDGSNPLASPYTNAAGSSTTTIFVRVENSATGCINDQFSFDVIINPLPDFQVTSPQIVCLNNPPLTLEVENPNAVYSYQWTNENGIILSNNSYQNVIAGGLYTVTATFTNGTGCTRTRSIQVNESSIATITYNDITIVDDSENNSITINPTNLGIGDYEYSLLDSNGNTAVDFQDEPLFEHLEGDIYTILVQDKNGCGIASLDVSVIEFPKFFTPNNDGIKDAWMVLGVNIDFYPESSMYIFNRYGKVISEIKMGTNGWNGLFNGKLQPSNDYWFHVILVDRNGNMRDRTGHFSLLRY